MSELYPDTDFKKIDAALLNPPEIAEVSVADLESYIKKISTNEWETVRAVYVWITHNISYDTERYFNGIANDPRRDAAFYDRKAICAGYATLFSKLLTDLEIKNKIISGSAYGSEEPEGHAWNAVYINENWYLFDSTWGAGSMDINTHEFSPEYKDYYFNIKPSDLIFSHRPNNPADTFFNTSIDLNSINPYWKFLLNYGLDSTMVLSSPSLYSISELVHTYGLHSKLERSINIISIPYDYKLKAGIEYNFTFETSAEEIMIINQKSEEIIKPSGKRCFFSYRPEPGKLQIYLLVNEIYYLFLEYLVEE